MIIINGSYYQHLSMKQFTLKMFHDYCNHKNSYDRWSYEYAYAIGALTDESTNGDYEDIKFIKKKLDELKNLLYTQPMLFVMK